MTPLRRLALCALLGACALPAAADWAPISEEVWAMKEDPEKGHLGAVVLEEKISFGEHHLEHTIRVRILSEAGRNAADLHEVPDAYAFEGRTVKRDGTIVRFDDRKDMQTRKEKTSWSREEQTLLVPPGVTADCVVEMRWREGSPDSFGPIPDRYGFFTEWILANRYPTLVSTVEFPINFPWSYVVMDPRGQKAEPSRGGKTLVYRNVPAVEDVPFCLMSLQNAPRLVVFWVPDILSAYQHKKPQEFWTESPEAWFKLVFKMKKGGSYAALSKRLLEGLPQDPMERAFQLMVRLDAAIRNDSSPTFAEAATRSEKGTSKRPDAEDLDAAAKEGRASEEGMVRLFVSLARDAGFDPVLALVANRNRRFYQPSLYSYFQFDDKLVIIRDGKGRELWIDPTMRFASPGTIWSGYQGSQALEVSLTTFKTRVIDVPIQAPETNVAQYTFDVTLEEDAEVFDVTRMAIGHEEWQERRRYMALEQKEQDRLLKERFERGLPEASIQSATVTNAQVAGQALTWTVKGTRPQEESRRRLVAPFPGLREVLEIPDSLPEKRTLPIVLPLTRIQAASSTVKAPDGHCILPAERMEKTNSFGSVAWVAAPASAAGNTASVVRMRIDIKRATAPPEAYEELKAFLAWIKEAIDRTLVVEKES